MKLTALFFFLCLFLVIYPSDIKVSEYEIPPEIERKFLKYLSPKELNTIELVKRSWYESSQQITTKRNVKEKIENETLNDIVQGKYNDKAKEDFLQQIKDQQTRNMAHQIYTKFYQKIYQKQFPQYYPKLLAPLEQDVKGTDYSVSIEKFYQIPDTILKIITFHKPQKKEYKVFFSSNDNPNICDIFEQAKQNKVSGVVLSQWKINTNLFNQEQITECIIQNSDIILWDHFGDTLLLVAIHSGRTTFAKLLIENGANINVQDKDGMTPLLFAIRHRQTKLAKVLIKKSANINVKNQVGNTPLHVAIYHGHMALAEFLIEKSANINVKNQVGDTPLHLAIRYDNTETAEFLIENGANINVKNNFDITPLHSAMRYGRTETAEFLIKKGANINVQDKDGMTPLLFAIRHGHTALAEFLIEKGANINVKNQVGNTPLHVAIYHGHMALAKFLISKKIRQIRPSTAFLIWGSAILSYILFRYHSKILQKLSRFSFPFLSAISKIIINSL